MQTYTYSEARQKLAFLLDKAKTDGSVLIKRKDGSLFEIKARSVKKSPLDVKGINVNIDKNEILDILKEIRER